MRSPVFRRYAEVLLVAVIVGGIHISHHFLIPIHLGVGQLYRPVTPAISYDESAGYGSRAKAFYDGVFPVSDTALLEHQKDILSPMPLLNPVMMGGLGWVLGSLQRAFIVSDFVFPTLVFLFLYALLFELTQKRTLSIVGAVLFIFVPRFALAIPPLSMSSVYELLRDLLPSIGKVDELYFSRFDYPQITYLFYVPTLFLILRALKRDVLVWTIPAGISFGLLFYTYFYDWAYVLVGLASMCVFFILGKKYAMARKVFIMVGVGFIIAIPYWINFFYLHALSHYPDLIARSGVEISHAFRLGAWKTYMRCVGFVGVLWFLFRRNDHVRMMYLGAFLLTPFVVLNMQMFAGFNPQPDHWYREQLLPFFLGFVVISVWFCERYARVFFSEGMKRIVWIGLVLFFGLQFHTQIAMSRIRASEYTIDSAHERSYTWLNDHTRAGSVVGTLSYITNIELVLYTRNHTFLPKGLLSLASNEEIWDRVVILAKFFNMKEEDMVRYMNAEHNLNFLFDNTYRTDHSLDSFMKGSMSLRVPNEIGERVLLRFRLLSALLPIPYVLDYLYIDERSGDVLGAVSTIPGTIVYNENGVVIYSLTREDSL